MPPYEFDTPENNHEIDGRKYKNHILIDREKTYGDPTEMYDRISKIWSGILNHEVTGFEVVLCMVGMKTARAQKNPGHKDSVVDMLGYSEIAEIIANTEEQRD